MLGDTEVSMMQQVLPTTHNGVPLPPNKPHIFIHRTERRKMNAAYKLVETGLFKLEPATSVPNSWHLIPAGTYISLTVGEADDKGRADG